ncbi:Phosphoglucomutase/phosphomannomutase [Dimargaris cristalligena]|uniref:Phosphoglucomutase/phosphomannomutase n=1 Tax=Dimargaris cristalligena TaxID=215637 RepID=A0A4P9ZW83_9FUNG|nr:Phosphoglucomutase/phosphomannomutase [Dimargaris cristalligena]|eukprot:RKP37895.1 Phosphoglucomutase/phosphomannomutase [Dimargaris cristalligena]
MEAGFSRMNELTVTQASQGLCQYVQATVPDAVARGVVIGHDHRHHSRAFAECTATAFLRQGFRVHFHEVLVHTPLVPFAVKQLGAACGVMITASHNPKADNGYKVYWANASQIIPPHDSGIAQAIAANQAPWGPRLSRDEIIHHARCQVISRSMTEAYFKQVATLASHLEANPTTSLRFVYTPMHGVGTPYAEQAFAAFNLPPFVTVPEQASPDPDFPTVKFPNPEEKGALDLAMATASSHQIRLVLANDPDADRFALAECQPNGEWIVFTGDQIGTMLAHYVVTQTKATNPVSKPLAILNSTVSSKMLAALARKEGIHYEDTLTGFKWLGNRALALDEEGYNAIFAYEEALGYMMGSVVPDKDGVTALALMAEMACQLHEQNLTISQHMEQLYERYGYFVSGNGYYVCHNPAVIKKAFAAIRFGETERSVDRFYFQVREGEPALRYPKQLGLARVVGIRDLTYGFECPNLDLLTTLEGVDTTPKLPTSAGSEMITFTFDNQCTLTLRTSGTEPKIKYYLEGSGTSRDAVQACVDEMRGLIPIELLRLDT